MNNRLYILLLLILGSQVARAGETLDLTANEVFFTPVGTLEAVEDPEQTGSSANNGRFFTHITNWRVPGDTIVWAVDIARPGELVITPLLGVPPNQENSRVTVVFDGQAETITLHHAAGYDAFRAQTPVRFEVASPGRYLVELTLSSAVVPDSNVADVEKLQLSGEAAGDAEVVIRRWRPFAVHARWESSEQPAETVLKVHQNTIVTRRANMYQPITTPFGYVGSAWSASEQSFDVFNFSLWSYGQNDPEPPIEELSHLIAVGPGLWFGEYGHEGTGVKPRGPSPYLGYHVDTQVIALRMEPGEFYDTYYSYYLDPGTGEWGFWGAGKKYNERGNIRYLTTGAFVEQPGVPARQRSNHVMREVRYNGWMMDKHGQWYHIDRMIPGGSLSNISYKNWGVKANAFWMQMGGFGENDHQPNVLELPDLPPIAERPDFLRGEMLEALYRLPADLDTLSPLEVHPTRALLRLDVKDAGTDATAEVFWGPGEGLTFDYKWDNSQVFEISNGQTEVEIQGLTPTREYHYRFRITNAEGITWTMHTQSLQTPAPDHVFADFSVASDAIFTGQSVAFNNQSFPEDGTFLWSFPGGYPGSSTQRHPVVTYHEPGVFDVSLRVTATDGSQDSITVEGCISVSEIQEGHGLDIFLDFQRNTYDLSGNGHHGTADPALEFVRDAERGWVASFDGQSEVELYNYYGVGGSHPRSMTAWVRTTHQDQVIVNWGRAQAAQKNTFKIDHNGYLRFEVALGFIIGTSTPVNNGEWHHVAAVFEGNGDAGVEDVRLYVNGQQEETTVTPQELQTDLFRQVTIGNDFFNKSFEGLMSDVRIYSRALTADELTVLMEGGVLDTSVQTLAAMPWVDVRQMAGEDIEIRLHTVCEAELMVYDLSGALLSSRRISPGVTHLHRQGPGRIAIVLIHHQAHTPVAEKVFW